ncbi:MAG: TonB-dependent receptor [Brachymonas sp.]|nr:TonB-dependent receptor [Brachymonas sp.]
MPSHLFTRCFAASLCCAYCVAEAQEINTLPITKVQAHRPSPGEIDLDVPTNTGSRLGLSIKETPASVYQVDRFTMEARGDRTTHEALRNMPGVHDANKPNVGGSLSYRGFSGAQITHLFNGTSVQFDMIAGRPVDSWIYDRVELIGGPSSFLYGAGAVGGSVNYITRLPQRSNAYEGLLRLGSNGTAQAAVGLNHVITGDSKLGNFFRLDANVKRNRSRMQGNVNNSQQIAASLLSDLTPKLTHTLALEYQHEKINSPYWGTPLLNPRIGKGKIIEGTRYKNYNSIDGRYEQKIKWARSVLDYRLSDEVSIKNTLYHYNAQRDYENVEAYRLTPDNKRIVRNEAILQRHKQKLVGNRTEVLAQTHLGKMKSDWLFGVDYSLNKQTRFPYILNAEVSTVDPYDFQTENFYDIPGMRQQYNPDRTVRVRTLGLFAENRTKLAPSLSLLSGLRHDRIKIDLKNHRAINANNPDKFTRHYAATTGRVGLMWEINPSSNAYLQYSMSADPPSGMLTTTSFGQARTNTDLSTGKQFEIGSKFKLLDGRATGTLAAYHIVRKNLATRDPSNPQQTILVGQQSSHGIELAVDAQLTKQLRAQANMAFVNPKFDNFTEIVKGKPVSRVGNIPNNTPRSIANIWLNYAFKPGWNASMGVRRVSSVYGDNANTIKAPAYTLLDFGLDYNYSKNLKFRANLRNATNKLYANNITHSRMFYLGEPRSFDVSMRLNFQ